PLDTLDPGTLNAELARIGKAVLRAMDSPGQTHPSSATTDQVKAIPQAPEPERVVIGGWVTVGPMAFSVRHVALANARAGFAADGPFCSGCAIRLSRRSVSITSPSTYSCPTEGCPRAGNRYASDRRSYLEKRAENLVEAAFKKARSEGRQPVVDPDV